MLRYIPPAASSVTIHTGNTLTIDEASRKALYDSSEELLESLKYVHKEKYNMAWKDSNGSLTINEMADYGGLHLKCPVRRHEYDVYAKIFTNDINTDRIEESLWSVLSTLKTTYIEGVVLDFRGGDIFSSQSIKKAWMCLEAFKITTCVQYIGVSGLDAPSFICLFEWALIKPMVMELHYSQGYLISAELVNFAVMKNVELISNTDPIDIISTEVLKKELLEMGDEETELPLKFSWALRYIIKHRGALTNRGYIVKFQR